MTTEARYKDQEARKKYKREYMRRYLPKYYAKLRKKGIPIRDPEYGKKLRRRAMELLGGLVCVECGCDREAILEINHRKGGGRQERKRRNSFQFYRDIIRNPDKELYEVLCRICNAIHYVKSILKIEGHSVRWNS